MKEKMGNLSSLSFVSLVISRVKLEANSLTDNVVVVSQANFHRIIEDSANPVVVDFWAAWCVPCRMISPILEELARERQEAITIAKLNVDENPTIAAEYGVMSIPTLIKFQDGQETARVVGALPKAQLLKKLGL
jgi:thioredoxin 1